MEDTSEEPVDRDQPERGPVEAFAFPKRLRAHVVEPGPRPRVHGYDVHGDLTAHYSFAELVLLAESGELPDEEKGRCFETALCFAFPSGVNEAPGHSALLARLCGATDASVHAVAGVGLAEQAAFSVRTHEPWLAWLDSPTDPMPSGVQARTEDELRAVERLAVLCGGPMPWPSTVCPTLEAAILAILYARCGLTSRSSLVTVLMIARLGTVAAEAFAVRPGSFRDYPMDLPRFVYRDSEDE
jgi:hypothetical protein